MLSSSLIFFIADNNLYLFQLGLLTNCTTGQCHISSIHFLSVGLISSHILGLRFLQEAWICESQHDSYQNSQFDLPPFQNSQLQPRATVVTVEVQHHNSQLHRNCEQPATDANSPLSSSIFMGRTVECCCLSNARMCATYSVSSTFHTGDHCIVCWQIGIISTGRNVSPPVTTAVHNVQHLMSIRVHHSASWLF